MYELLDIETERLQLRRLCEEDAKALQDIGTDQVFEMIPEIKTPFDAREWTAFRLEKMRPIIGHVVIERQSKQITGYTQVTAESKVEGSYLEVGFWYGSAFWRKGYATEALIGCLRKLLSGLAPQKSLIPLHAKTDPRNKAALRVLKKSLFEVSGPPNGSKESGDWLWFHWPYSSKKFNTKT